MTLATDVFAIDADKVQAGWIALAFVVALGVAVFLLIRSMNKQLHKVDFEPPEDEPGGRDDAEESDQQSGASG
jgi:hypothetical protein